MRRLDPDRWPRALLTALRSGRLRLPQPRRPLRGAPPAHIRTALSELPSTTRRAVLDAWNGGFATLAAARDRDPLAAAWQECIATRRLPQHDEAALLAPVGRDRWGRRHWLQPVAARALGRLRDAARAAGIELEVVSSFRSVRDQRRLLARKLAQGRSLAEILRVNAPPGCSEHHGGGAVDLAVPGEPVLTEAFADTAAFAWLNSNARHYGFRMSYPADNAWGYLHEPWHWCWSAQPAGSAARHPQLRISASR